MMFREMRRAQQMLSVEESRAVLSRGTAGVLAVAGDDDYPYAVPLSYVHDEGKIYFHCAPVGHKLDAIARHDKASFCVIDQDTVVPEKYTTYFRSVIAFGRVRVLEAAEKRRAFEMLAARYSPDQPAAERSQIIDRQLEHTCLLELTIEHLSGKEAKELAHAKAAAH